MRTTGRCALSDLKSAVYVGKVRHRRHAPVLNAFSYRMFMLYLDLEELPQLFDDSRLWSYERRNVACWRRSDYIGPRDLPIADAVRWRVKHHTGITVEGPIRMLGHARYCGYCFNPVVLYYCFNQDETLAAIVAEITNTPWGERHAYVLPERDNKGTPTRKHFVFPKTFHVSPFMDMDYTYDWRFLVPNERIAIHMRNVREGEAVFDATLSLKRQPLNAATLRNALLSHPLMTADIVTKIHWQALRLWAKRVPFVEHPSRRPEGEKDPYAKQDTASRQ